ncbi:MAG TPA: hypothetical protein ENI22_00900 [Candidatus Pacearchaeota archaeon]|nr:hypothetical protein [Candidatus Pacearchaeota archaeon]
MNLSKKKELARRTLGIGKERIIFLESRLEDIKEAITKQDIRDLQKEGAILIREIRGKRKAKKRRNRNTGNIRKKVKRRKKDYVIMTRKLRKYVSEMKKMGKISKEDVRDTRKKIRNKIFISKSHLKEHINGLKK